MTAMSGAGLVLLSSMEPAAVEVVNPGGAGMVVLVCDHASNRVPRCFGSLGLDAARLADHIAWDPGAAAVARALSVQLDAPLVLSGYSRLVIDCNRPPDHVQSIAEQSAGVPVPGNHGLTADERERRVTELFRPYHDAIARLLDGRAQRPTLLLSIHSFTPVLSGRARPWHVGISQWRDRRLAGRLIESLTRERRLIVGDSEPYPIEAGIDYTIPRHGGGRGLPSAMIEIRQDGIRTAAEVARWVQRLTMACRWVERCWVMERTGVDPVGH
jgi:predicted N-formylglutamate amidohydrolase